MRRDLPRILDNRTTPENVFFDRRSFMKAASVATIAGPLAPVACGQIGAGAPPPGSAERDIMLKSPLSWPDGFTFSRTDHALPAALRQDLTPRETAAAHNNFYEFLFGQGGPVWKHTGDFTVSPWKVEIAGACRKPMTIDLDDLFAFPHEERLYHFRCVERWAMNVPWTGFPLRALLERVDPLPEAKYVKFLTARKPREMPGLRAPAAGGHSWPYYEGLRLDEAMHDLAFVVTGAYGKPLLKQHGAPLRIAVPWKYGYKSPKSIVRIELMTKQPPTFWSAGGYAHEYGFVSNVNPNIPHPRWSQSRSRWLDTGEWFDTPIFNGYDAQVAALYADEPRVPQKKLRAGQRAR